MEDNALVLENLKVYYENFFLTIDYYEVKRGYVTGLIGKNGAGKTTMINAFLELIRRNHGKIEILGMNFDENDVEIKERIAYVNDQFIYPLSLNAARLGKELGSFYRNFDYEYFKKLCSKFNIPLEIDFKHFSLGMKTKISILFPLAYHPEFIILDEPTANLDPVARHEILELLYETMQDENNTILFSTHITSDLDKIADIITLIDNGNIEFTFSKDELQDEVQLVTITGRIPNEMKKSLRGIKKTDDGYTGLCINSTKFKNYDNIHFKKATIEEIMITWEIRHA